MTQQRRAADKREQLDMSEPESSMTERYYTNAPENYDYAYVETIESGLRSIYNERQTWRLIEVSDAKRFIHYQIPRYSSGRYVAVHVDHNDAPYLKASFK